MIDCIVAVYAKNEIEFHDRLDWVRSVIKIGQDNDITDHTSVVYAKNNIELSWPIWLSVNSDENQIG